MSKFIEVRGHRRRAPEPDLHSLEVMAKEDGSKYAVFHHGKSGPFEGHEFETKQEVIDHLANHIPDNGKTLDGED